MLHGSAVCVVMLMACFCGCCAGWSQSKRTSTVKTGLLQAIHSCLGNIPALEYTLVKDPRGGRRAASGDSDEGEEPQQGSLGAGVAEQQVAQAATLGAATLGAAMLGGTAMMGTAGLAML